MFSLPGQNIGCHIRININEMTIIGKGIPIRMVAVWDYYGIYSDRARRISGSSLPVKLGARSLMEVSGRRTEWRPCFVTAGLIKNIAQLKQLFDLFVEVLDVLCQMDPSYKNGL